MDYSANWPRDTETPRSAALDSTTDDSMSSESYATGTFMMNPVITESGSDPERTGTSHGSSPRSRPPSRHSSRPTSPGGPRSRPHSRHSSRPNSPGRDSQSDTTRPKEKPRSRVATPSPPRRPDSRSRSRPEPLWSTLTPCLS